MISSHEEVVQFINQTDCTTIYNVDYHSDVINAKEDDDWGLTEGSWANCVDCRANGTFVWRHPHDFGHWEEGYCHGSRPNPFHSAQLAGWKTLRRKLGLQRIPWARIAEVCICLSPTWTHIEPVRDILHTIGRDDLLRWGIEEEAEYNVYGRWKHWTRPWPEPYLLSDSLEIIHYEPDVLVAG